MQVIYAGLNIPQFSEDSAHSSGDKGVPSLVVRKDTATSLAGSDGDYTIPIVDSVGRLHTNVGLINSYISSANSTTATLGSNGVFTGTGEDVSNYATIGVQVKASHASASNGLSLQFSVDGTNWDITTNYTVSANSGRFISVPRYARYFRVVYTTNSSVQTYFRLQTIYSTLALTNSNVVDSELPSAATLTDGTVTTYTVPAVGAVGMMFNGTQYDRVRGSSTDGLLVNLGTNNDVTITSGTITTITNAVSVNDNGGSLTVDGTVGISGDVNVTNSGTFAVQAAQFGTWNLNNISGAISLPTGASTEAKQDTIIGHVDGIETLLSTIDGDTGNISSQIDVLAGAVVSSKVQVDIISAPTITVSATALDIRALTSSDVVTINGGAGQTDDVKITLDGEAIVLDASSKIQLTDGITDVEVVPLTTYNGLAVAIVDGNGDQITSFGGGTQYTEGDADATITGTAMMMEVAADTLQPVQGTVADGLLVNLGSNNDVTVTGTVTVNAGTNLNTSALALETTATSIKNAVELIDNAISGSEMQVDIVAALPAGTNAIGKLASNTGVTIGAVEIAASQSVEVTQATASSLNAQVVGSIAHDSPDSGNPVKIGGKASTTLPTAVSASGDRVDATYDRHGYQVVRTGNQAVNAWTQVHEPATNTQATCTQSAPGANLKNIVTSISGTLSAGSTAPTAVQVYLRLVEDAAGTPATIWSATLSLPATAGSGTGVCLTNVWIPVTSNKSITLRFSAAGGTNTFESVSMQGIIVAE